MTLILRKSGSFAVLKLKQNLQRIYANEDSSFPLNLKANGLQQARAIARHFSSLKIRAVHTSPILRAMQTAEEICKIETSEMQIAPE